MSLRARIAAYDQAAAAARAASAPPSVAPADDDAGDHHAPPPFCTSSSTASQSDSQDDSSSQDDLVVAAPAPPQDTTPCRANEHLAVLIPRDLWKPDRLASHCDKYACRIRFSLFERKHHCRKCGGVFCQRCSERTTPLLDTTRLPFLLPPKGTPITAHAAPHAPIHTARVCDDCFEQLHGYPTPRAPSPAQPLALATSVSSVQSLPPVTPPDGRPVLPRASTYAHPRHRAVKTTKLDGVLDRYPLKDPSATCKAAGGGRWSPTPIPQRWDARLPDGRFVIEADAERRAEAARLRLANPVIVDGPIRVRRPRPPPCIGPPPRPTF